MYTARIIYLPNVSPNPEKQHDFIFIPNGLAEQLSRDLQVYLV